MQSFSEASPKTITCNNLPAVLTDTNTNVVLLPLQAYNQSLTNMKRWFQESEKVREASFEQVKTDLASILSPIKEKNILEQNISKAQSFKQSHLPVLKSCLKENKGVTFRLTSSLDEDLEINCQNLPEFFTEYNDTFIETLKEYARGLSNINQWFQKSADERAATLEQIAANTEDTGFLIEESLYDLPLNGSDMEIVLVECLKKPGQ